MAFWVVVTLSAVVARVVVLVVKLALVIFSALVIAGVGVVEVEPFDAPGQSDAEGPVGATMTET